MEIQIADSRLEAAAMTMSQQAPAAPLSIVGTIATAAATALSPDLAARRNNLRLTTEFRTLSIQLNEPAFSQRSQRRYRAQLTSKWREWLYELFPIRSALQQRMNEEYQREQAFNKVADQLKHNMYHIDSENDAYNRFGTSPIRGLEWNVVRRRTARDGKNLITPHPIRNVRRVIVWFFGGFNRFLWIAMVVFWLCWKPIGSPPQPGNMALAIVIMIVILIQASFSAWQEWITSRALSSITSMLLTESLVTRDGRKSCIPPAELVQGDVVHLRAGDKVPADLRLVDVSPDLLLDRSVLTGIPDPTIGTVNYTSQNYLETRNMAMMGVNVSQGFCTGIVVATGSRTVLGRLAKLSSNKRTERTILQIEVHRLVNALTTLSLVVGVLFIVLWAVWLRNKFPGFMSVSDALANGVGVLVTFVPGGLPISFVLALTAIARRMQRHDVLIKNLTTVETLGTVDIICCEKTGTLTQRRMRVARAAFGDCEMSIDEISQASADIFCSSETDKPVSEQAEGKLLALRRVYESAALCNDAMFDPLTRHLPVNERTMTGDATDCALLRFAEHIHPTSLDVRPRYEQIFTIPFNLRNRWMLSISRMNNTDSSPFIAIKGAPETLLPMCTQIQNSDGEIVGIDREAIERIERLQLDWAKQGCRVLLLCRRDFGKDDNPIIGIEHSPAKLHETAISSLNSLCIVGLTGMVDPPRDEIPGVVDTFRKAGIRVFMVTGDYAPTAAVVARQCGIITGAIVDGVEDVLNRTLMTVRDHDNVDSHSITTTSSYSSPQGSAEASLNLPSEEKIVSSTKAVEGVWHDSAIVEKDIESIAASNVSLCSHSLVISGQDMIGLQPEHWDMIASYDEIVFARITPEQKLLIVEELRIRDHYIAVTGDDANDLPAMRAAHVGVAMGNGSEVAREAAEIVLLDNNFSSIVVAIECGRLVFVNLKKVIIYLLPMTNLSEIIPSALNVCLGLPIPLSTFLMLVINTVTDVWASIKLIEEEPEDDLLTQPPRNVKNEGLVNTKFFIQAYGFIGMFESLSGHFMFFLSIYLKAGIPPKDVFLAFNKWTDGYMGRTGDELKQIVAMAGSVHFITLVIMQWGNMFVARTRRVSILKQNPFWGPKNNAILLLAIPISICVSLFVNEIHWFNFVFLTGKIPVEYFFFPIPLAIMLVLLDESRKFIVRRYPKSLIARMAW